MALVEKYISVAGGGLHDGSSEANAWTLAEALSGSGLSAGDRGNMISGSYSSVAAAVTNVGTNQGAIVLRGYNSSIGDLVGDRVGGNGELILTNYPVVTLTGVLTPSAFTYFEAISFTGALSSALVGNTAVDNWGMIGCSVVNTQNNAAARAVVCDNDCRFSNNDFECSGASHASVFDGDQGIQLKSNRFKTVAADCCTVIYAVVENNIFYGDSSSSGIVMNNVLASQYASIGGNTFYGLDTAIEFSNLTQNTRAILVTNNFASDCANWIDCAYVGTANQPIVEVNNWLYNITTPRTGVSDFPIARQIGPTSGAAGAYFEDAANGDFNLIASAPGYGAGLWPYSDVGAVQALRAAGGGGGLLVHPGMSGGLSG